MSQKRYRNNATLAKVNMVKRTITTGYDTLRKKNRKPKDKLPIDKIVISDVEKTNDVFAWLGHSSMFIKIQNKIIFVDPVLSHFASPIPFLITSFHNETAINLSDIAIVDIILLTHNHYDHLDKQTIKELNYKTKQFIVPKGIKQILLQWGVEEAKIFEHQWGDTSTIQGIQFICEEAQHNSRRGVFDSNKTLWCSWIIKTAKIKIFFSGDSGYGPHFRRIGSTYGPFDLAMIECGQYDYRWSNTHMLPEHTYQASIDINAAAILPIHWGSFTLAFHPWYEPIEKILATNQKYFDYLNILTPKIGELVLIKNKRHISKQWWKNLR